MWISLFSPNIRVFNHEREKKNNGSEKEERCESEKEREWKHQFFIKTISFFLFFKWSWVQCQSLLAVSPRWVSIVAVPLHSAAVPPPHGIAPPCTRRARSRPSPLGCHNSFHRWPPPYSPSLPSENHSPNRRDDPVLCMFFLLLLSSIFSLGHITPLHTSHIHSHNTTEQHTNLDGIGGRHGRGLSSCFNDFSASVLHFGNEFFQKFLLARQHLGHTQLNKSKTCMRAEHTREEKEKKKERKGETKKGGRESFLHQPHFSPRSRYWYQGIDLESDFPKSPLSW